MTLFNAPRPFNDPSLYFNGAELFTVAAASSTTITAMAEISHGQAVDVAATTVIGTSFDFTVTAGIPLAASGTTSITAAFDLVHHKRHWLDLDATTTITATVDLDQRYRHWLDADTDTTIDVDAGLALTRPADVSSETSIGATAALALTRDYQVAATLATAAAFDMVLHKRHWLDIAATTSMTASFGFDVSTDLTVTITSGPTGHALAIGKPIGRRIAIDAATGHTLTITGPRG